jgi:hypothetical protein
MSRISPQVDRAVGIMDTLFAVFRESIEDMNEDMQYFAQKLKMYNDIGEALSNYLSGLVDVMNEGGGSKTEEPDTETATRIVRGIELTVKPLSIVLGRMQHSPLYAKLTKQVTLLRTSMEGITREIKRPPKPRFRIRRTKF